VALKPCLACGEPTRGSRCGGKCGTASYRASATSKGLGRQHQRIAHQLISDWVSRYGWVCPGWKDRAPHSVVPGATGTEQLTADHIIPRTVRPDLMHEPSNYAVLCRGCNSHKNDRV
jgi:5-methylcytosine-specific restriction endonuclease McrA